MQWVIPEEIRPPPHGGNWQYPLPLSGHPIQI